MAITGSTPFGYVVIGCNCERRLVTTITPCTGINPRVLATGTEAIGPSSSEATKVIQRGIMRDRVRDGNAEVHYYDSGEDVWFAYDELPERLAVFMHPQHDIHPNDGPRSLAALVLDSDVTEDSDTKRKDIKLSGGWIPQRHEPFNGELDVSPGLPDGFRVLSAGDNWSFRIVFPSQPAIDEDNYGDSVEVLALLEALESIRSSGNAINVTPDTVNLTSVNVRTYRLEQTDGEYVEFNITQIAHGENVLRFSATWDDDASVVDAADAPDHAAIQEWLDGLTFPIAVDFAAEKPQQGSPELPHVASMFSFDGEATRGLDVIEDHLRYRGMRPDPWGEYELIVGEGYSLPYSELEGTPKNLPAIYGLNAIHFGADETGHGEIAIPTPVDLIKSSSGDRPYIFHNRNDTYSLTIRHWDNGIVIVLRPGERATLRVVRRGDGSGELTGDAIRRLYITGGDSSALHFGIPNYWTSGSRRIRPVPKPVGLLQGDNRRNAEAFTAGGTQTWADGDGFADAGVNTPDAFGLNRDGILDVTLTINVLSGSAGSLNTPNLRLARNGNGDFAEGSTYEQRTISAYLQRTWFLNWRGAVELADVFLPVITYPSTSTMSLSTLRIPFYALRCELTDSIAVEYTP